MRLSKEQKHFIATLKQALGVVSIALQQTGVRVEDYQEWLENPFFKEEVDKVADVSLDFVENQLIKEIKNGNMAAIQYYLKTKGKHRGYN